MILLNYLASFFLITLGLYCIVVKHDLNAANREYSRPN